MVSLKSYIYEGKVRHRRNTPKEHQFDFRTFMLLLDLDELNDVFRSRLLWSTKRLAPFRFRKSDYLKDFSFLPDLKDRAIRLLRFKGCDKPIRSVRLLTQLRYFGFAMNPVSFYYCYGEDDSLAAIIAEVNNTPWGEQHCYVIEADEARKSVSCENLDKTFHVSPFMSMAMSYRMAFSLPGQRLGVKIENHLDQPEGDGIEKILDVTMLLKRKPITSWSLNLMLFKFPLISFQIFLAIYWQALRLYLKGIPFVTHPKNKPNNEPAFPSRDKQLESLGEFESLAIEATENDSESILAS